MFPNGMGIVFERRIHEQMMPSALKAGLKLESVPVVIEHHGYGDPEMMKRKAERNANLLIADYNKNSPEPVTAVEIADSYTIMERYSDAQYWYRHVLSIAGCVSDFPAIASQAWMGLGNISNREKDYKSAIESFQNSLKHCPGRPDALYGLAVSYHMDGAYQPAVEALEQIINSQSRTPVQVSIDFRQTLIKAYIRCAAILGTQKKFEELGKLVTKAIAVLGERPEILNMAGTAYFQQNKMMDALHTFEKSLNVATAGNIDAYIGLCMIYIKVGKPETASITLENIKPLFSMSPRYLAFLEMANLKSGRVYSKDENEKIAVEKEYLFRLYQQK
jgi:tetratricopeptide (TPR) repeat protein